MDVIDCRRRLGAFRETRAALWVAMPFKRVARPVTPDAWNGVTVGG
jgi:hypothetical protein